MLDGVVPYPPELAARYRGKGYWEDRSLASAYFEAFARSADRVAIVAADERVTYRQLTERAERLALGLLELGLRQLDRVVMQLPNVPEFVYLYFALQKIGAAPIMALPPHRHLEIRQFVQQAEAVGLAIPHRAREFDFLEMARRIKEECSSLRYVLVQGDSGRAGEREGGEWREGYVPLSELLSTESERTTERLAEIKVDPTDPAVFQLSGGTTGIPKLIARTHNDYLLNVKASAAINDIRPNDALLVVLPAAHNFPLASPGLQGFLLHGARVVLSTSSHAEDILDLVERQRITHLELVPALLVRLINDPRLAEHDLSSVRVINSGGQKLQPQVKRRTEELVPSCKVQEVFGMAEGMLFYVRLDDPPEVRLETVGRPLCPDDEFKLVDDDGREVAAGEIGELLCRGPYTLRGYFRAREHNARAFTPDGFYRTGDLMRLHPSGNCIVEGRKKDLINRGGEKISAEEVENLALRHPAVQNVACVPFPDPVLGERMCACIIPRPGTSLTLEELASFLLDQGIARFKLPERVELMDELPMSPFGKVSKQTLAKRFADG
jgi:2,3-dihydroxybenzoate---[aryl-carrier protein] ligase